MTAASSAGGAGSSAVPGGACSMGRRRGQGGPEAAASAARGAGARAGPSRQTGGLHGLAASSAGAADGAPSGRTPAQAGPRLVARRHFSENSGSSAFEKDAAFVERIISTRVKRSTKILDAFVAFVALAEREESRRACSVNGVPEQVRKRSLLALPATEDLCAPFRCAYHLILLSLRLLLLLLSLVRLLWLC